MSEEELMLRGIADYKREQEQAKKVKRRQPAPEKYLASPTKIVCELVEHQCKLRAGELISRSQQDRLVKARQIAMMILRRQGGYSLQRIGSIFRRHHSTVMYAIERLDKRCVRSAKEQKHVDEIVAMVEEMGVFAERKQVAA